MNASPLAGQVAVVTGAASGIGLASASALAAAGARVVMVDRDADALRAACAPHGDAMVPLQLDLLDAAACASLVPQALEKAGRIDILHANAGLYIGGDLVDADSSAIDRLLQLNVAVVMKNVHDVLPHMQRGKETPAKSTRASSQRAESTPSSPPRGRKS